MTVAELNERADLNEEARQLATPDMPVRTYVEQLAKTGLHRAAISALLQLLPKPDAIAWGLESVRKVEPATAKPKASDVLAAVDAWLEDPTDERRRAALAAAEQAGVGSPAGCLGLAVFLCGGSLAPPHVNPGPEPAPYLYAKAIGGAMAMAAVQEPVKAPEYLRLFVDRGFEWASRRKIWEEEK